MSHVSPHLAENKTAFCCAVLQHVVPWPMQKLEENKTAILFFSWSPNPLESKYCSACPIAAAAAESHLNRLHRCATDCASAWLQISAEPDQASAIRRRASL